MKFGFVKKMDWILWKSYKSNDKIDADGNN